MPCPNSMDRALLTGMNVLCLLGAALAIRVGMGEADAAPLLITVIGWVAFPLILGVIKLRNPFR